MRDVPDVVILLYTSAEYESSVDPLFGRRYMRWPRNEGYPSGRKPHGRCLQDVIAMLIYYTTTKPRPIASHPATNEKHKIIGVPILSSILSSEETIELRRNGGGKLLSGTIDRLRRAVEHGR